MKLTKLTIFPFVLCLCVSFTKAHSEVRIWGDVNGTELGRMKAMKIGESSTVFCFTYPEVKEGVDSKPLF